ncbi:MAG TPA: LysR family transcriptional regulator [Polyangiaceae bacterium]|jgi:LysR family transcriptional activator of mexEF-oprN operon|nr:LysR family transcriptional regulator [Polyangiaceae bacterium]
MNTVYGRDLDLNLLRVFVVAAEAGSVTEAAGRLYVTQPAVSAALGRLRLAVGGPLFAREGRGLALTARGERLLAQARPALESLVASALSPVPFDAMSSERTIRLGLSDSGDAWLLPSLLKALAKEAPRMQLIVTPVQFRIVGEALRSGRVDLAVTVADEMPKGVLRVPLFTSGFVCLHDPRYVTLPARLTVARYLSCEHVIVSYNGDLRGVVEDILGLERRVRVSVPTFQNAASVVDGSALLATVPNIVAHEILRRFPHLATVELPFKLEGSGMELLFRRAMNDDPALAFIRGHVQRIAKEFEATLARMPARGRAVSRKTR